MARTLVSVRHPGGRVAVMDKFYADILVKLKKGEIVTDAPVTVARSRVTPSISKDADVVPSAPPVPKDPEDGPDDVPDVVEDEDPLVVAEPSRPKRTYRRRDLQAEE